MFAASNPREALFCASFSEVCTSLSCSCRHSFSCTALAEARDGKCLLYPTCRSEYYICKASSACCLTGNARGPHRCLTITHLVDCNLHGLPAIKVSSVSTAFVNTVPPANDQEAYCNQAKIKHLTQALDWLTGVAVCSHLGLRSSTSLRRASADALSAAMLTYAILLGMIVF